MYAVAVLIITPQGIPLVRNPKKPLPRYWKLPGGRSTAGEKAKDCAIREIEEEIGVSLHNSKLKILLQVDKGDHILVIFLANLSILPQMKPKGDEGEEIGIFTPQSILVMHDFFPNHRKVVKDILATLY